VLPTLRVEQVEGDTADVGSPHLNHDIAATQRDGHRQRDAVLVVDKSSRNAFGIDLEPVLLLVPRLIHALLEISLPVEEADADHAQTEVRCLLEDVAGEDAETARVDGQGTMNRELGAQERDRV